MQPPSKRSLRPTVSVPTTAEFYGEKHGIPDQIQLALQNVGRKGRMAVSQGRTFDRTQSFPVVSSHQNPFQSFDIPPLGGFMTTQETLQHAERSIQAAHRRNELRPYSDTIDPSSTDAKSSPSLPAQPLAFSDEAIDAPSGSMKKKGKRPFNAAKKRDLEGSDTETDDVEEEMIDHDELPDLTFTSTSTADTNDFPPVFTSPQITQPELFARPARALPTRQLRGMPGRSLGKTVSAPVGGLGRWGGHQDEMQVDGQGEQDGFEVADWAASENF